MNVKKWKISIIGATEKELEHYVWHINADSNNESIDEVVVEFEEPLKDAMAALAWPWPEKQDHFHPRPPLLTAWRIKLSNVLCRFKVTVAGIRKAPIGKDASVSLLVSTYMDYKARATEVIECLEKNIQNPRIGDIHLFIEDPVPQWRNWLRVGAWEVSDSGITPENAPGLKGSPMETYPALEKLEQLSNHPKVKLVPFGRRAFFTEYFEYANQNLPAGRAVVLANTDIQFGEDVGLLAEYDLQGVFGCLSRNGGRIFDKPPGAPASMSSDAWMFSTPMTKIKDATFPLGVRAGEYLLSFMAMGSGCILLNPCLSVYGKHCHTSQIRHWPRFPWITSRMHAISGVSLEALESDRFGQLKKVYGL